MLIPDLTEFLPSSFLQFVFMFFYNLLILFLILHFIYGKNNGLNEYKFSSLLIAAIVFEICILLDSVPLELGFAIGLFALFGVLRYRTNPIPPREMTYLFISIGISAKNALGFVDIPFQRMVISDLFIIAIAFFAETTLVSKTLMTKTINYDNIELIAPEKRELLIKDLEERLGIKNVQKIKIGRVDLIKPMAKIKVYFKDVDGLNYPD